MDIRNAKSILDLSHTEAAGIFKDGEPIHLAITRIADFIKEFINSKKEGYREIRSGVFAHESAKVSKEAVIMPGVIIGKESEIRPFAYLRGNVVIGSGAVIGNSTEIKNSVIFDGAQLPHYNYIGDSIVGYKAHFGAGAILSNFRLDHKNVKIHLKNETMDTGLRKFGGIIGDEAEIGCGAVICPGRIIGKKSVIYPLSFVNGTIADGYILKK